MYVTIVGVGFQRKINLPADSTLSDLKDRLKEAGMSSLNAFYVKGNPIDSDHKLKEDMTVMGVTKAQAKATLG